MTQRSGRGATAARLASSSATREAHRTTPLVAALLTSVAYVDPGNFATNLQSGARFHLELAWVVVVACAAAVVVQVMAARLGSVTGKGLAEVIADWAPRWLRLVAWIQLQVTVIMTDLAEIVGGALGLQLLFGISLPVGAVAVGLVGFGVMAFAGPGRSTFRIAVLGLLAVVGVCTVVLYQLVAPMSPVTVVSALAPHPMGSDQVLLASAIVGATIMPHALYFHSAVSAQAPVERARQLWIPVSVAMTVAAVVSLALLLIGTGLPTQAGDSVEAAHAAIGASVGAVAGTLLGVALLASGFASTLVGVFTGSAVTVGLLEVHLPDWVRRLMALAPPVVVLVLGMSPVKAIVVSQAALSVALPLSLIPLVLAVRSRRIMGDARIGLPLTILTWVIAGVISCLAVWLVVTSF